VRQGATGPGLAHCRGTDCTPTLAPAEPCTRRLQAALELGSTPTLRAYGGGSVCCLTHSRYFCIHQCLAARWCAAKVVTGLQGYVSSGTLSMAPCSTSRCGVSPERIQCNCCWKPQTMRVNASAACTAEWCCTRGSAPTSCHSCVLAAAAAPWLRCLQQLVTGLAVSGLQCLQHATLPTCNGRQSKQDL
jgi:hypothetical protein